ncbi:hypothetical protein Q8A67_022474 [Cirrhinus molitorella]|uniref:Uncharacterized protein n=1 Tax=Cirrhinus molitorella TaxID=172907 RepID=A0AA88P8W9_9TELE|nr:hypothetical protein Q8A67_022474 [Cirrhinus molitorella]
MHELVEVPSTKVGGNEARADAHRGRRLWVLMLIISEPYLQTPQVGRPPAVANPAHGPLDQPAQSCMILDGSWLCRTAACNESQVCETPALVPH